ncbi:MAG: hypothetical protein K8L97_28080 [Anaerolineae bacterium]|nr:hypothetical protein [Anaerolineae bacterium]
MTSNEFPENRGWVCGDCGDCDCEKEFARKSIAISFQEIRGRFANFARLFKFVRFADHFCESCESVAAMAAAMAMAEVGFRRQSAINF